MQFWLLMVLHNKRIVRVPEDGKAPKLRRARQVEKNQ